MLNYILVKKDEFKMLKAFYGENTPLLYDWKHGSQWLSSLEDYTAIEFTTIKDHEKVLSGVFQRSQFQFNPPGLAWRVASEHEIFLCDDIFKWRKLKLN